MFIPVPRSRFIAPILLGLFFLGLTVGNLRSEPNQHLGHPNSYIGNADWDRKLVFWREIGELPLSQTTKIPVRFRFKPGSKVAQGEWAKGAFFFPLFQSSATVRKNGSVSLTTLGGRTQYLDSLGEGRYQTEDGAIQATLKGEDLQVVLEDGTSFIGMAAKRMSFIAGRD